MGVEIISNPLSVSALLSGEIDHHTAAHRRLSLLVQPPELMILFQRHRSFHTNSCLASLRENSDRDGGIS